VKSRLWRVLERVFVVSGLLLSILLTFVLAGWLTLRLSMHVPEIGVPDVAGLAVGEAGQKLSRAGLSSVVSARRADPARPPDTVIEQFPAAGTRTKRGRTVRLVVNQRAAAVAVPDLVGGNLPSARLALRAAGLSVGSVANVPAAAPVGRVIGQSPSPGSPAEAGPSASLLLSAGPAPRAYVMPDVVGRLAQAVAGALRAAGFRRVGIQPAGAAGFVTAQSPPAGRRVTVNDAIALRVDAGS